MATREIKVQRFSVTSSRSFSDVVSTIEKSIGHPEMSSFSHKLFAAKTFVELEKVVDEATGPLGLMEFTRMDLGAVLRKRNGASAPQSLRLVIGNPVIMSAMVQFTLDAGSYAPVTVLIDERPDGVHMSYDRRASYIAVYGSSEALKVAEDLDAKVEGLLTSAAG